MGLSLTSLTAPMGTFSASLTTWQTSMEVNSTGLFTTMRTFGDAMAANGAGSIVNIASIYGMVGMNPWLYEGTTMTAPPDYSFSQRRDD